MICGWDVKLQGKERRGHPAPFLLHLCERWEHSKKTCLEVKTNDSELWGKGGTAPCASRQGDEGFKWEM